MQPLGVIDKESRLLTIAFDEMFGRHLLQLGHALADRNRWHHDDELGPAIAFVHLEDGLDIARGLARTGLHLDIKVDRRAGFIVGLPGIALVIDIGAQGLRSGQVLALLHLADVFQQGGLR